MYPQLSVSHIKNPQKLWAIPLLGILGKTIYLIPVFIELLFLYIGAFFIVVLINPFVVLFTGRYWDLAYRSVLGIISLSVKIRLFFLGLTDKYPGFGFNINDPFITFDVVKPQKPKRFFAVPILGGLVRVILLIPYFLYSVIIDRASQLGAFGSFLSVLFFGKYPQSTYEFVRDSTRVSQAQTVYLVGLSDSYPSFWISMNHKIIKIILIVISTVLTMRDYIVSLFDIVSYGSSR